MNRTLVNGFISVIIELPSKLSLCLSQRFSFSPALMKLKTIHAQPPLYLSVGDHVRPHHDVVHQPGVGLGVPGLVLGEVVGEVAADVGGDISELFTEEILLLSLSPGCRRCQRVEGGVVDVPLRRGVRGGGRGRLLAHLTDH